MCVRACGRSSARCRPMNEGPTDVAIRAPFMKARAPAQLRCQPLQQWGTVHLFALVPTSIYTFIPLRLSHHVPMYIHVSSCALASQLAANCTGNAASLEDLDLEVLGPPGRRRYGAQGGWTRDPTPWCATITRYRFNLHFVHS